jgi:U3 small nucleolar RNA-associated protein 24
MGKKNGSKVKAMARRKKAEKKEKETEVKEEEINPDLAKYFEMNHSLVPPYNVILDTNFINMSLRKKLDIERELVCALCSRVRMHVPDCVVAELEKLGRVHTLALQVVRGERFHRLACDHKGTYADDCLAGRVQMHRCFLVATCDSALQQRLRKIPGVPIVSVHGMKYFVESLPSADIFRV